jgi:hypothetical protein
MKTGGLIVVIVAAVVAAVAVNYVLLGYGGTSDDPVGRLTPRTAGVMARVGEADTRPPTSSQVDDDRDRNDNDRSGDGDRDEDD